MFTAATVEAEMTNGVAVSTNAITPLINRMKLLLSIGGQALRFASLNRNLNTCGRSRGGEGLVGVAASAMDKDSKAGFGKGVEIGLSPPSGGYQAHVEGSNA
jgi:hypothetical protein